MYMFCPRKSSACHAIPQILEHSTVSHGGRSNTLLLDVIFQAPDGLRGMKTHDLSDLTPQAPDLSKEGRLAALPGEVEVNPWEGLS